MEKLGKVLEMCASSSKKKDLCLTSLMNFWISLMGNVEWSFSMTATRVSTKSFRLCENVNRVGVRFLWGQETEKEYHHYWQSKGP
jgi:hypothetical protein